jgi:hypothetical protein
VHYQADRLALAQRDPETGTVTLLLDASTANIAVFGTLVTGVR